MKLQLNASRTALIAASALALAPSALAQARSGDGDTLVVTGVATPVEQDKVGQSITVIPAKLIEDQGYAYVPDVLRQVPAVAVSQAGAPGSLTQVRIRGAEANHTLVLLDGIDISSPDQGETDFSTLLAGNLSRIEVLRGPQSGLYGSNALAGVINLVSRRETDGHTFGASIEAGSFNTLQLDASAGIGNADTYASISVNRLSSDGYDVSPDQTAAGVPAVGVGARAGDNEGNEITTVNLRGGAALSDILHVNGVARYLNSEAETDGQAFNFPIPGLAYDDASTNAHEQYVVGASATLDPFAGAWETTFSASRVDETRTSTFTNYPFLLGPPVPTPDELLLLPLFESKIDSTRTKYGVQSTLRFGDKNLAHFLTGFVEREEETYDDKSTNHDEKRKLDAFGLQYRVEIANQLDLYVTGRRDQHDTFQDADTYSLAASWAIPDTGARLHTSYGTGVTSPTFVEQFGFDPAFFIGNPALVPEEAVGWDFGVEQSLFADKLIVDLTYFASTLDNEIFTPFIPAQSKFMSLNRGTESDRDGWELSVTATPTDDISLYGTYTKLDATQFDGIETRRPENQASLDASWKIGGGPVQINLGVTYNSDMVDTNFGTGASVAIDPYTLVRLGASWQATDQVELYTRIENLTDESYQEVFGYDAAPQAVYVGLRFRDGASK